MSDFNELARFVSGPGVATLTGVIEEQVAATYTDLLPDTLTDNLFSTGFVPIPLGNITREDGTALTAQATTVAGYSQISNKETVINIPVNCTAGEALGFSVATPLDLDTSADLKVKVMAGKAADLDVLTLACEVYQCAAGDVGNADIQGTSAVTITQAASVLTFTCAHAGLLEPPGSLSVVLTLGGTNDGDAVYIYAVWLEYTKTILVTD